MRYSLWRALLSAAYREEGQARPVRREHAPGRPGTCLPRPRQTDIPPYGAGHRAGALYRCAFTGIVPRFRVLMNAEEIAARHRIPGQKSDKIRIDPGQPPGRILSDKSYTYKGPYVAQAR